MNFLKFFLSCYFIFASANDSTDELLKDYKVSCYNAKSTKLGTASFCSMVDWPNANLYNSTLYSNYNPGFQISTSQQDLVAKSISDKLINGKRVHAQCYNAVNRFVCLSVFPYCPLSESLPSSAAYLPACQLQCKQVNQICGSSLSIECNSYKEDKNCMINVPESLFLLDPKTVFLLREYF